MLADWVTQDWLEKQDAEKRRLQDQLQRLRNAQVVSEKRTSLSGLLVRAAALVFYVAATAYWWNSLVSQ